MAYQFFHIETYSRKDRPVKTGGRTVPHHFNNTTQVLGEALREAAYSKHVENAESAKPINDRRLTPLEELRRLHDQAVEQIRLTVSDKNGNSYQRRLKSDADTLYTEIHSHPMTPEELKANIEANKPIIAAWGKAIIDDFWTRMPEGVKASAVIHLDESHVHIHILALNMEDPKLDANKLHAGKIAAAKVAAETPDVIELLPKPELIERPKKPKKERPSRSPKTQAKRDADYAKRLATWEAEVTPIDAENAKRLADWEEANKAHRRAIRDEIGTPITTRAYRAAMRKLQDDYYEAVGKPSGFLRHGPRLAHNSTKEHAEDKRRAAALAKSLNEQAAITYSLKLLEAEKQLAEEAAAKPLADLEAKSEELERRKELLDDREERLTKHHSEITAKEADLVAREDALKLDYAKAEEEIKKRVAEIEPKEAELEAREQGLIVKEQTIEAARIEIEETTAGMAALMDAVENDQIDLIASPRSPQRLHKVFMRLFMTRPEQQSPLQNLLGRFVNFLKRGQSNQAGPSSDREGPEL